jgi:hypothetical protein
MVPGALDASLSRNTNDKEPSPDPAADRQVATPGKRFEKLKSQAVQRIRHSALPIEREDLLGDKSFKVMHKVANFTESVANKGKDSPICPRRYPGWGWHTWTGRGSQSAAVAGSPFAVRPQDRRICDQVPVAGRARNARRVKRLCTEHLFSCDGDNVHSNAAAAVCLVTSRAVTPQEKTPTTRKQALYRAWDDGRTNVPYRRPDDWAGAAADLANNAARSLTADSLAARLAARRHSQVTGVWRCTKMPSDRDTVNRSFWM